MTTYVVTTTADSGTGSLREAITLANANAGADTINFDASLLFQEITLTSFLPVITDDLNIVGNSRNGTIISGSDTTRIFFVGGETAGVDVTISHLTLENGRAKGGDSGPDTGGTGGGGLGAGGAVFVRTGASLTLDDVVLDSNVAVGGGTGGFRNGPLNGGGGGGLGGNGAGNDNTGSGNGGGGAFADGTAGSGNNGGTGGGPAGGAGGVGNNPGQNGGDLSGGGGGGLVAGTFPDPHEPGGAGGFGGGGGGGDAYGNGGAGGFGGGGGGGGLATGGDGGFGGGGGGSWGSAGAGGFGGGDGANGFDPNFNNSQRGGGGAGFGGAVFVMDGAALAITGTLIDGGGSVTGGSGTHGGSAAGSFLFLQHTGVTFGGGGTQDIYDTIADDYGNTDANNDGTTGDTSAGGGVTITGGTVDLHAASTYHGATTVQAGTLQVDGSIANSAVTVKNGASITGYGGTTGALTVEAGGHVAPGASNDPGALHTKNLSFASGSEFKVAIDNGSFPFDPQSHHGYSYIGVTGTVALNGATLTMLSLDDFAPSPGESYKIIDNDGNDAVSGTFAGLAEGATLTLEGETLAISYVGGTGNDVVLSYVAQNLPAVPKSDTISIAGKTIGYTPWVAGPTQAVATDSGAEFNDNGLVSNFFSGNALTLSVPGYYDSNHTYSYSLPGSVFVFTSVSTINGGFYGINANIVHGALVVDHAKMEGAYPVTLGFTVGLKENGSFSGDLFADNGNGVDSDPDGDAFSVTQINGANVVDGQVVILPSGASLTIHADGTFSYDANHAFDNLTDGQTAQESFTYTITGGATATMSFAIAGQPDNLPPVAKDDPGIGIIGSLYGSTAVSNAWIENNGNYMFTDLSVDATGVGHIWFGDQPGVQSFTSSDVHFSIGPNFVITSAAINPSTGASGSYGPATVTNGTIEVLAHPDINYAAGPLLIDFTAGLREGASFSGDLFADNGNGADNDPDSDPIFVTQINGAAVTDGQIVTLLSGARLTIHTDGTFSYDTNHAFDSLNDGQTASESFSYTITGGSTATASFMIVGEGMGDSTPPTVTIGTIAGDDVVNAAEGAAAITVSGTASGAEDGQTVTLALKTAGGSPLPVTATATVSGGVWSLDLPANATPAFPDGDYIVTANVSDAAGNPATGATRTIAVDTHAPSVTINTIAGNDIVNAAEGGAAIRVSGTATGAEDGQTVTLALKTANGATTLQTMTTTVSGGAWHIDLPPSATPAFPDGNYLVTANVSDAAGNAATEATRTIAVDTHAPSVTINAIAGNDVVNAAEGAGTITVSGTATGAENGQVVTLALKTANGLTTLQTMTAVVAAGLWHIDLPPGATPAFPDGPYLVAADVSDAAGNPATQATHTITVDTHAPSVTISTIAGNDVVNAAEGAGTITVSGTAAGAEDGQVVTLALKTANGATTLQTMTAVVVAGLWHIDLPPGATPAFPDGDYLVTANVSDAAGNPATEAARMITVDVITGPAKPFDFDGDGKADILLQNPDGGAEVWLLDGVNVLQMGDALPHADPAWHAKTSADFDRDGKADILWQRDDGATGVWLMDGTNVKQIGGALAYADPAWHATEAADFDGDGKADILWQRDDGATGVWLMDGTNVKQVGGALANPGPSWHTKAAADFNGDGKADILWQNDNGATGVWLMDGVNVLSAGGALPNADASWHAKAAADFNGDGKADILWQNDSGAARVWLMDGTSVLSQGSALANPGPTWHVKEAIDANGDGKADILWQNDSGTPGVWLMDGTSVLQTGGGLHNPGAAWHII